MWLIEAEQIEGNIYKVTLIMAGGQYGADTFVVDEAGDFVVDEFGNDVIL
jgi:hypothetical protein